MMTMDVFSTTIAMFFCMFMLSCSSPQPDRHTILFRARIFDVKQLSDGSTSIALDVMHVGREPGGLVPGNVIQVHFNRFPKFYGKAWMRNPQLALGFADNYQLDRSQDGSFSRLQFSPKGSPDVVLRSSDFFDYSHKTISIDQ